jgi:hypothetical protein
MKQYIYTPKELGLDKFDDGILRLNCDETRDPHEADVFVVPQALHTFKSQHALSTIPYMLHRYSAAYYGRWMEDNSRRHVFLDISEHFTTYEINKCIFIRAALTKQMLEWGPNSIPWSYPVEDFRDCLIPSGGFQYDVTFHGFLSCLARKVSVKSCRTNPMLKDDIKGHSNFYGYQERSEQHRRMHAYRVGLKQSRMALCAESIPGVLPYRFYEAMSAGRCQLYIGRNFVLPFADKIHYHDFVSFLDIDAADEADVAVKDWLSRYSDEQLITKGRHAREAWETWLQPNRWVELMTVAVAEKLKQIKGAQ